MSAESRLRDAAAEATGDDSIIDVAEFRPRGSAAAAFGGAAAGGLVGGAVEREGSWGSSVGGGIGYAAGREAQARASDMPKYVGVAVSESEVYLLEIPYGFWSKKPEEARAFAKIDRDKLGVEVHQRVNVRVVVLEDLDTGHKFELEAERLNRYHAKALIELLKVSDQHHEPDEPREDKTAQ